MPTGFCTQSQPFILSLLHSAFGRYFTIQVGVTQTDRQTDPKIINFFSPCTNGTLKANKNFLVFFLFRYLFVSKTEQDKLDAINLMVYVFNSVIMLVDLMTVTHPIILGHTYWTIGMGLAYTIFTVVYYLVGGTSR